MGKPFDSISPTGKPTDSATPSAPDATAPATASPAPEASKEAAPTSPTAAPPATTPTAPAATPDTAPTTPATAPTAGMMEGMPADSAAMPGAAPADPAAAKASQAAQMAEENFNALFPEPSVAISNPPSWIMWIVLLGASAIVGVVGYRLVSNKLDAWLTASPTATPTTITSSPSPTATTTVTATATPTATASITPTATPISSTTINKSTISIRVLNGTTTSGLAATVKSQLENAGFTVRTIGNAQNQNYTTGVVYYQSGQKAAADLVLASLTGRTFTEQESTTLASPDMVLVVVGAK